MQGLQTRSGPCDLPLRYMGAQLSSCVTIHSDPTTPVCWVREAGWQVQHCSCKLSTTRYHTCTGPAWLPSQSPVDRCGLKRAKRPADTRLLHTACWHPLPVYSRVEKLFGKRPCVQMCEDMRANAVMAQLPHQAARSPEASATPLVAIRDVQRTTLDGQPCLLPTVRRVRVCPSC